jgi:cytidine deaminase
MITNGEFRLSRIVAVWKNEAGEIFVLAPCGTCRQLIYEFDKENLDTDVIMGKNRTMKLKELLPYEKHFSKI